MSNTAIKIMMLGEIGVGKTSIVRRLVFDAFDISYKATIGVDIYSYRLPQEKTHLDRDIDFFLWDVDGDLGAAMFNHVYLKGAGGACIVSDVTRAGTHKTSLSIAEGFERNLPGRPAVLVVNKIDLLLGERPPGFVGAYTAGIDTIWTSAATGYQVLDAFVSLGKYCATCGF